MTQSDLPSDRPAPDLWPTVPRLLSQLQYGVLSTADASGAPWGTPVFFATADCRELYWVSAPDSRHSRNLAVRPQVAIAVFDSTVPVGQAEAVYLTGEAGVCEDPETALEVLNARLTSARALASSDLAPHGPLTAYRAEVTRYDVLIRGGNPTFGNVVDRRHQVQPPS